MLPLDRIGIFDTARKWERREPETLDWIDRIQPSDVFVDIGSSWGTESLYAALKPNGPSQIFAFDCDLFCSHHFAVNLKLNHIQHIAFYLLPLSDHTTLIDYGTPSSKYLCDYSVLGAESNRIHYGLRAISFDEFCAATNLVPHFIKIDVDGDEFKVLSGMQTVLGRQSLRSILVEVQSATRNDVLELMTAHGFHLTASGKPQKRTQNLIFDR